MARETTLPNPENATIAELKETAKVGSSQTALRCVAIQMLIAGIARQQVCLALEVSVRSLQLWTKAFNEKGIDGLIVKKGRGRKKIIRGEKPPSWRRF